MEKGYYVCHKCGLPRGSKGDVPNIGHCTCLGQTTFEYEEELRPYNEAVAIAKRKCEEFRKLYQRQGRPQWKIDILLDEYAKVSKVDPKEDVL